MDEGEHQAGADQTPDTLPLMGRISILAGCIIAGVVLVAYSIEYFKIFAGIGRNPHDPRFVANAAPGADDAINLLIGGCIVAGAFFGIFAYYLVTRLIERCRRRQDAESALPNSRAAS